jgi:hypothetical protein
MPEIKNIGKETDYKGYAYDAQNNRVEEHTYLKVQRLFTVVIHKIIFFLVRGP